MIDQAAPAQLQMRLRGLIRKGLLDIDALTMIELAPTAQKQMSRVTNVHPNGRSDSWCRGQSRRASLRHKLKLRKEKSDAYDPLPVM